MIQFRYRFRYHEIIFFQKVFSHPFSLSLQALGYEKGIGTQQILDQALTDEMSGVPPVLRIDEVEKTNKKKNQHTPENQEAQHPSKKKNKPELKKVKVVCTRAPGLISDETWRIIANRIAEMGMRKGISVFSLTSTNLKPTRRVYFKKFGAPRSDYKEQVFEARRKAVKIEAGLGMLR